MRPVRCQILQALRLVIKSINETFTGQIDLRRYGEHPCRGYHPGVRRILALTAAIWHNNLISVPTKRSLLAYDQ